MLDAFRDQTGKRRRAAWLTAAVAATLLIVAVKAPPAASDHGTLEIAWVIAGTWQCIDSCATTSGVWSIQGSSVACQRVDVLLLRAKTAPCAAVATFSGAVTRACDDLCSENGQLSWEVPTWGSIPVEVEGTTAGSPATGQGAVSLRAENVNLPNDPVGTWDAVGELQPGPCAAATCPSPTGRFSIMLTRQTPPHLIVTPSESDT